MSLLLVVSPPSSPVVNQGWIFEPPGRECTIANCPDLRHGCLTFLEDANDVAHACNASWDHGEGLCSEVQRVCGSPAPFYK